MLEKEYLYNFRGDKTKERNHQELKKNIIVNTIIECLTYK